MNNENWTAIASVFTGKGGTIKLTIFGSLIAATVYEILNANYNFSFTSKGTTVSLRPEDGLTQQMSQPEIPKDTSEDESADDGTCPESQQV